LGRRVDLNDERIRFERARSAPAPAEREPGDGALRLRALNSIRANREPPRLGRVETAAAVPAPDLPALVPEVKERLARETAAREDANPLEVLRGIVGGYPLLAREKERLYEAVRRELFGYGPLEEYMTDSTVTEVVYDAHDRGFIERDGNLEDAGYRFDSPQALEHYVQNLIKPVGRPLDERNTNLNAKLVPRRSWPNCTSTATSPARARH
jgi:hypothetical protein